VTDEQKYDNLTDALAARQKLWTPVGYSMLFAAVEMGGEAGEALNVVKKLERERMGWPGSRSTKEKLAQELSDVVITAYNLAALAGIYMPDAVVKTFNDKSIEMGFPILMEEPLRWNPGAVLSRRPQGEGEEGGK
jgi:NTP pyrophosphatase (non-canonical NTP hydrolase)